MKVDLSCPIELWEYELPTDESAVCAFTFFNLGQRAISSIQITVTFFGVNDEVLSRRVERPMALDAAGRESFEVQLPVEGLRVEAVDLSIDKAWFEDGSEWRRQQDVRLVDYEPNELPPNRKLEQLRYVAGEDAVGFPSDQGAVWVCVCGRVNAAEEERCRRCDRDREMVFEAFSPAGVQRVIDHREAELEEKARQAREEASRLEFMRQDAARRRKRTRRMRTVIISVTTAVAVLAYLFFVLGLPELKYQTAMSALASNDIAAAREGFEGLQGYRDAQAMVSECDLRLSTEYAYSGDMDKIDQSIEMLTALQSYPGAQEMLSEATYQKGQLFMADKDYEEASEVFAALRDYRDAPTRRNEADYQMASQAMADKNYEEAARGFAALGNYQDAAALAKECVYRPAIVLMSEGDYTQAAEMLASITGYKDANEQRMQSIYQDALHAQLAGDPEYAAERFALLGDYEDSPEQVKHSIYLAANSARDEGKYEMAITLYATVPNYQDSAEQIQACTYLPAKALMDEGKYEEAAELFDQIPDYLDAKELYHKSLYQPAKDAMEAEDYDTAAALFQRIEDYSDAAKLLQQARYKSADRLEIEGQYEAAAAAFESMGDYSDAADRAKGALYAWAESAFDAGDFMLASERFEALGKYANAPTRVKECAYKQAMLLFNESEYELAYNALMSIEDYEPAKEMAREAAYMWGETLIRENDLEGATEAFALAGRYSNAQERRQECIYVRGTDLLKEEKYQEAGALFDTIVGYLDARAMRDRSYDMWLSGLSGQAEALAAQGDLQGAIDVLRDLNMEELPKSYASLKTLYQDANLRLARDLIAEDKALEAYAYLVAADDYKNAKTLLDKNIYHILGTWETADGERIAFFLNGTAQIGGQLLYFNMFTAYGISTGESTEEASMTRAYGFSSSTEKTLQLREEATGRVLRLTRVKGPEVSPTDDAEGSVVLTEEELQSMEDPVVDSLTVGGEVDMAEGLEDSQPEEAGEDETVEEEDGAA